MKFTREFTNGLIIFIGIAVYFILLELLGLSDVFILKIVNIFIIGFGVNRTIKGNVLSGVRGYFRNFIGGVLTCMIGAALSIGALLIYIKVSGGQAYLENLSDSFLIGGGDVNSYTYTIALLLLIAVATALITSFVFMQYWKDKAEIINKVN